MRSLWMLVSSSFLMLGILSAYATESNVDTSQMRDLNEAHYEMRHSNITNNERPLRESSLSRVAFYVMGDGPYGSKARERFLQQLQRLESRPEFLVHLGDVHEREKECTFSHYDSTANDLLEHVNIPTFVLPGDADWYSCNDQSASWNKWSERYLYFHRNWPVPFDVRHQESRPENFSFTHKGVLFIGIHVLYATVRDRDTWNNLVHDAAVWLREQLDTHADEVGAIVLFAHAYAEPRRYREFYDVFVDQAQAIGKPILYLHGDEHAFLVDRRFPPRNILRVVLDESEIGDPLQVTVDPYGEIPFRFKRRFAD